MFVVGGLEALLHRHQGEKVACDFQYMNDIYYRSDQKNTGYVQEKCAGRRKSGAYMGVYEHFKEDRNTVIGR